MNKICYKSISKGMALPIAMIFAMSGTAVIYSYYQQVYSRDWKINYKIAKYKAKLNAQSGVAHASHCYLYSGAFYGGEFNQAITRDIDVNVYSLSPDFDIDNDYRLNFLRDAGVLVKHVYGDQYLTAGLFRKALWSLINFSFKCSHKLSDLDKPLFSRISRGLGWRMFLLLKSFSFGSVHIENFLNHRSIKVLCCF